MPKHAAAALTFENAMAELESLTARMESGELTLEASLAAYQRGAELVKFCRETLAAAELQVKVLEDGVLKDFDAPTGAGNINTPIGAGNFEAATYADE
jgi:exodeoxyribonuclease VII small subunit